MLLQMISVLGALMMGKPSDTSVVDDFDVEGGRGDSNEAKIEIPAFIDRRSRA